MVELEAQYLVNPLTLEAKLFLKAMDTYGKNGCIDFYLLNTLEKVVSEIDKFLLRKPTLIAETPNTKLIADMELNIIERNYHCAECKQDLGTTIDKVAAHVVDTHRLNQNRADLRKEKRRKEQEKRNKAEKEKRKAKREKRVDLPKKAKSIIKTDYTQFFEDNIKIAEKLKQIPEYEIIEKELESLISPLFPEHSIKLYKFGSRLTGIGMRYSDLDIFVDIDNSFNTFENRASEQILQRLYSVRDALRENTKSWKHLVAIDQARVPILRVCNVRTGIDCDIGFSNSLGYCNTKLMEYLFNLQPTARRLCIFLKRWLERAKLCEHISTYSITLMVVFFLQLNKCLPPIETLQTNMSDFVYIGPWIGNFVEKHLAELCLQKLDVSPDQCKKFVKLFFEFYAKFDFAVYAVCPYLGKLIAIKDIENEMPERYTNFAAAGKEFSLELNKSIVVQDPIQLNHNVTKGISPFVLKNQIINYFKQSVAVFEELK